MQKYRSVAPQFASAHFIMDYSMILYYDKHHMILSDTV
jgi:hypothetical protein